MNCKVILAVALVALVAIQAGAHPVKRSCACNLRGSDVCSSPGCVPAPRPVKLRAPTGLQRVIYQKYAPVEFNPKNVCTCEGGLVTAPEIPRVPCKVHSGPANQAPNYPVEGPFGQSSLFGNAGDCGDNVPANPCEDNYVAPTPVRTYVIPAEDNLPAEELVEEVSVPAAPAPVAADAVSLALAYDLATRQQKNIREENLAFGHTQTPKDGRVITKKRIVPEDGLYAVRNQIVELKAPSGFGRSCEDEAEASLLAAQQASCQEQEEGSYGAPLPSYRDLGFSPVSGEAKFVPGQYQPSPQVVQTIEYSVPAPRAREAAPVYTPCDALASIERGRGNQGIDYYAPGAAEEVVESEAPCASESGSSFAEDEASSYSSGLTYGAPSASYGGPSRGSGSRGNSGRSHTGRPGCSCGCGY